MGYRLAPLTPMNRLGTQTGENNQVLVACVYHVSCRSVKISWSMILSVFHKIQKGKNLVTGTYRSLDTFPPYD